MLATAARTLRGERAMRGPLRDSYDQYMQAARAVMQNAAEAEKPNLLRRLSDSLKLRVTPIVRAGSIYQAQRGYNTTIDELRRLGVEAERKALDDTQRTAVLEQIDDIIRRKLDPLPDRVYRAAGRLGASGLDKRYARSLSDELAKAASTYGRVHGERVANEEQGTGWWMWVTVGDEKVRRSHRHNNRIKRRIGDLFPNRLRFPRDPLGEPAERENCRCHTRPVKAPSS